ncbi:MAG: glycosyltransferase [Nibricoccus sp.]
MTSAANNDGILAGKTILRFAHAYESGGGTERYLDDVDQALLSRNAMTIVRMHITRNPAPGGPIEQKIGRGTLVRVPLPIESSGGPFEADDEETPSERFKRWLRNSILYQPIVWDLFGARYTRSRVLPKKAGQAIGAGPAAAEILLTRRIDAAIMHFFGGADAEEVLQAVNKASVPCALLNHYSNDRFLNLAIRKHTLLADRVSGVNGLDVPSYARGRFVNLSDGIDIDFFRRQNARPLANPPAEPIFLLPARVTREKGQLDLIQAAARLHRIGTPVAIAFAGRFDNDVFTEEVRALIAREGLNNFVHFLGPLNLESLRDWYAASAAIALPTYHHEGLPRILLEAQAMECPVIAYATGGVADGVEEDRTGYLLKTGDKTGLVDRMHKLATQAGIRARLGKAGRIAAESRFNLAALAQRHEQFYLELIRESASTKR